MVSFSMLTGALGADGEGYEAGDCSPDLSFFFRLCRALSLPAASVNILVSSWFPFFSFFRSEPSIGSTFPPRSVIAGATQ